MKSKTNAMRTIAITYGISCRDASRVLQGDALHHLRDTHATVGGALQRVVHLLPLQNLEGLWVAGEQIADGCVVDRIRFFLELLDMPGLLADELRLPDRRYAGLNVLRGLNEYLCKLPRWLLHDIDVQHLEAARRSVQQVDHIIQTRREHVNVLAIDWRDEARVDTLTDRARDNVRLVLDVLDRANVIGDVLRIVEQPRQHARRLR